MGGLIQIVFAIISIKLGIILAKVLEIPISFLLLISKIGENIPLGSVKIITPDFYLIIIYYIFVFISLYLYNLFQLKNPSLIKIRIKKKTCKIKIKKIVIIFFIMIIVLIIISKFPTDLKISFVDVDQGDCSLILTPNKKTILVDGGGSYSYDVGKNVREAISKSNGTMPEDLPTPSKSIKEIKYDKNNNTI